MSEQLTLSSGHGPFGVVALHPMLLLLHPVLLKGHGMSQDQGQESGIKQNWFIDYESIVPLSPVLNFEEKNT